MLSSLTVPRGGGSAQAGPAGAEAGMGEGGSGPALARRDGNRAALRAPGAPRGANRCCKSGHLVNAFRSH